MVQHWKIFLEIRMSNKIALLGDLHWGIKNDATTFHKYFEKCYNWMFNEIDTRGVVNIIQLGDFFDRRKYINFNTLQAATDICINRLNQYNTHILAGNHDCYFRGHNDVNSISLTLKGFTNITVHDSRATQIIINDTLIDVFPWLSDSNLLDGLGFAKSSTASIAVGHFEFANFEMYKGHVADHGMDASIFNKYDKVFSGHYHTRSNKGNIYYTGIPYELTWGDYEDQKGITFYDLDTGEIEFVPNPHTKFQKIYYDDINAVYTDLDTLDLTDKFVKVVVINKTNFYQFEQYMNKILTLNAEDVKIIEESTIDSINAVDLNGAHLDDTPTLIDQFIDELQDINIDKSKLKSMVRGLYVEASNFL